MKKLMILTMALVLVSLMIVSNASADVETMYHGFNTLNVLSPNNFGGDCGPMDPDPGPVGTPETIAVSQVTDAAAGSAYAMKMDYKYADGTWVGWWSFLAADRSGVNVSSTYTHFKMEAKGSSSKEIFKIEMKDAATVPATASVYITQDPDFATGCTTAYQTVDFSLGKWAIDFTKLKQVNLVIDSGPLASSIFVDEMRFTGPGGTAPITVTVSQTLAVDVSGSVDLGTVAYGQSVVGSSAITVRNSGTVPEQFYLSQIPVSGWTPLSAVPLPPPAGANQYVLCGVFNTVLPSQDICIKTANVINLFPKGATATSFAGDANGNNVAAGTSRLLWIGFMSPSSTMISDPQTIIVVVTAASPTAP